MRNNFWLLILGVEAGGGGGCIHVRTKFKFTVIRSYTIWLPAARNPAGVLLLSPAKSGMTGCYRN